MSSRNIKITSNINRQATTKLNFSMLILLGICFGGMLTLNRIVTDGGVPVLSYVFWQALGSMIIVLFICIWKRNLPPITPRHILLVYIILALLNFVIPFLTLATVASRVPTGVLSIGLALIPFFIYGMSLPLKLEKLQLHKMIGLALGLTGVLLVLIPRTSLPDQNMVGWVVLGLLAPVCWSLRSVLLPILRPKLMKSLPLIAGLLVASTLMLSVMVLSSGNFWYFQNEFTIVEWAVIAAIINNVIMLSLIYELIRLTGPLFFSTSNYVGTLVGVGMGTFVFGDVPSIWIWIAVLFVFSGLFLVNFWDTLSNRVRTS